MISPRFKIPHPFLRRCLPLALGLCGVLPLRAALPHHARVDLICEKTIIAAREPFDVAIRLQIDPHWHTYWKNPGDAGLATTVKWLLPYGFRAEEIRWPVPRRLSAGDGVLNFGYENEVWHWVRITPGVDLAPGRTVSLQASVDWLECGDVCVPARADLVLDLKTGNQAQPGPLAGRFEQARKELPLPSSEAPPVKAYRQGSVLILQVTSKRELSDLTFFPYEEQVIQNASPQKLEKIPGGWRLAVPLLAPDVKVEKISGVLATSTGWNEAGRTGVEMAVAVEPAPVETPDKAGLALTLLLGFVGGLILNLMPCVFPVLAVKILGFVGQAGEDRRRVAAHGWVFASGVLLSFWLLGGLLLVLRAGGQELGWGFQLQSPAFVYVLAALFFLFGLNLSGVFEVGLSAIGIGSELASRSNLTGSFFSGMLAAVAATPCAAPFLAPALGAALVLPTLPAMLLFTCMALGLALPYLLLSFQPGWVRILPRPGAWMATFKQVMAFPLFATTAYLIWVLDGQVDESRLLRVLFSFPVLAAAVWIYGRWAGLQSGVVLRRLALLLSLLMLTAALGWAWPRVASAEGVVWQKWSPELVEKLRGEGRTVYVDFTARWCATCQTNKAAVFSSEQIRREFREKNVVTLRADWTNRDPQITAELARWQRSAVPFDLLYLPGRQEPVVLPEILTPGAVLQVLQRPGPR